MVAKHEKYEQALEVFGARSDWASGQFLAAICLTQLGKYSKAQDSFDAALRGFLKNRQDWHGTSRPNWLVDSYVLAGRPNLWPRVAEEIEAYKVDPRGRSLVALYAYALACLISHKDSETSDYVSGLLRKPKVKDTFAMGKVIAAIVAREQQAFDEALSELLDAHQRIARFGSLRETPEGFLSLPAMSLSKMALERGLAIGAESEYLSKGYLDYLVQC